MREYQIYKSRNFITLLNEYIEKEYLPIYKSRNFITLLNSYFCYNKPRDTIKS